MPSLSKMLFVKSALEIAAKGHSLPAFLDLVLIDFSVS